MNKNTSQLRAIAHLSGPMMVLAGPGSGKTSVIVERTYHLIHEGKAAASSILVVTFSRNAAVEMRERFLGLENKDHSGVTFGTFHGVFYGILKNTYNLGAENILSGNEKYEILKMLAGEYAQEQSQEGGFLEEIAKEISQVKAGRIAISNYYSACCPDEIFRGIYGGYRRILKERRKLDFDDMLLYCDDLFVKRPDILALWQERFKYILVDEFQDISPIQYHIIRMLSSPLDNLFIVGDDDQSIYHFRGARPEIMLRFPKDYPQARMVHLDINYRCTKQILSHASRLIGCNKVRYKKNLTTPNPDGEPVRRMDFENPQEEYLFLARTLKDRCERGEELSDTAILFRTNQEAEGLVRRLLEFQVPFVMREQLPNLFDHFICQDILSYMHLAEGDRKRAWFLRIMNRPNRYIQRDALPSGTVDFDSLMAFYQDRDWMQERITTLLTHLRILKTLPPFAAVNFIRRGIRYEDYLQEYAEYRKIKPEELFEVLDRLQDSARSARTLEEWEASMNEYREELKKQAERRDEKGDGVTVSTLHQSKGLEYKNVYILNVNEGSIPYRKAVLPDALEEERRLLYVGMTRAKERLTLCLVKREYDRKREPSRFLQEAGLERAAD